MEKQMITKEKGFVIGFSGAANNGKSTCMAIAKSRFPEGKTVYCPFSGPLKRICSVMFGLDFNMSCGLDDENKKIREQPDLRLTEELKDCKLESIRNEDGFVTPRTILQTFGTEIGRKLFNVNIWINAAERIIMSEIEKGNIVLLDDVRYQNEVELVKKYGFLVHVIRPDRLKPVNLTPMHSSEVGIKLDLSDDREFIIPNIGTMEQLDSNVSRIISIATKQNLCKNNINVKKTEFYSPEDG